MGAWIVRTDNYTLVVPTQVGIDVMHTMDPNLSDPHRVLSGCRSHFPNSLLLLTYEYSFCVISLPNQDITHFGYDIDSAL